VDKKTLALLGVVLIVEALQDCFSAPVTIVSLMGDIRRTGEALEKWAKVV
jgi:hypothetical protein